MVLATQEQIKTWLDKVGYLGHSKIQGDNSQVWYSNFDDSFIIRKDMMYKENGVVEALVANRVTEQLTHCSGYSPANKMWYGWSHKAFYGFTVGSEVKRGDCAYKADNKDEYIKESLSFWSDEHRIKLRIINLTDEGFDIEYEYSDEIPNKQLRGTTRSINFEFPEVYGRGEWTAKTMEDAKQMALDFAEGVD